LTHPLVVGAVIIALLVPTAAAGMVKFVGFLELPADPVVLDRWYFQTHSRETVRMMGPWMRRYESYRALDAPKEAERFNVVRYRMTESMVANIEDREEMAPRKRPTTLWPQSDAPGPFMFKLAKIAVLANPTETFVGQWPPFRDKPYFRWMMMIRYPEGVSLEEGERWYLEVHAQEAKTMPGLLRFVSYRSDQPDVDFLRDRPKIP
jgi:hypothetical protein